MNQRFIISTQHIIFSSYAMRHCYYIQKYKSSTENFFSEGPPPVQVYTRYGIWQHHRAQGEDRRSNKTKKKGGGANKQTVQELNEKINIIRNEK